MASIVQRPTPPNEWLHNGAPDYTRIFSDYIIRSENAKPWAECTTAEKEEWQREHPNPEEPEDVEEVVAENATT